MHEAHTSSKIISLEQASKIAQKAKQQNQTIALANGAFDILHVGHIRYLEAAKQACDILFVAVNSDSSVRQLKGSGRPIMPDIERAELLSALMHTDYIVIFHEQTVEPVLRAIKPHYHVKGTDYTAQSVPEASLVESLGGKVLIVGDPKNHSSTHVIQHMQSNQE